MAADVFAPADGLLAVANFHSIVCYSSDPRHEFDGLNGFLMSRNEWHGMLLGDLV